MHSVSLRSAKIVGSRVERRRTSADQSSHRLTDTSSPLVAEHAISGGQRSAFRFGVGLIIVLTALVGTQLVEYAIQGSADRSTQSQIGLARDAEQIRYYDELLTMSARLAAATGDDSYVERYHQAVPKLDRAITDALSLARDQRVTTAFRAIGAANQELIALEEKSFRQAADGDGPAAYATVTGADYLRLRAEYSQGMDDANTLLNQISATQQARTERSQRFILFLSLGGAALVLFWWLGTAMALRRSDRVREAVEELLRSAALHDPLTGVANWTLLADRIRLAGRRRDRGVVALFYADLDDFKVINDEHGHPLGDQVLAEVAARLQTCVRAADTVARVGGDQFAVLVEGLANAEEVPEVARRFGAALLPPIEVDGTVVYCGASIGSVTLAESEPFPTPDAIVQRADLAMYVAKRTCKGSWTGFEQHLYDDLIRQSRLKVEVGTAFERHQFAVWYQPVVDLRTGAMTGAEALVRWHHPEGGLVSPDDFLPVLEELGRMPELTRFVLGEACPWAHRRQIEFPDDVPFSVAVNVSPRDLTSSELVRDVGRALAESRLPASSLTIEVTETALFGKVEDIEPTLTAIRAMGVSVAVDDFGTGFSAFAHLRQLPVDVVKIDKSFVDGLATELVDSTMVAGVVRLAHTLSLSVVAEGVEEVKQLVALAALECEFAQGYLLARPAPPEAFPSPSEISQRVGGFDVLRSRPGRRGEKFTVLLADDGESERRLLHRALERSGHFTVVGEAEDGLDAVRFAGSLNPGVVLLDLDMPLLDGLSALPLVLASAPAARVVILSGHVTDVLVAAARAGGAVGCIEKGFADVPTQLLEILEASRPAG